MSNGNTPEALSTQGRAFMERFKSTNGLEDLDMAIDLHTRALRSTPNPHPSLRQRLIDLGIAHTYRFRRLGDIGDLDKAVEHQSTALRLTPAPPRGNPFTLHGDLGTLYNLRFRRLGDPNDVRRAIEHKGSALNLLPQGDPLLSRQHSSLAASYADQARFLKRPADLEKAIQHQSMARDLTPKLHRDRPFRLVNLGAFYNDRFRLRGDPKDLQTAIDLKLSAIGETPDKHPDLPGRYMSLAASLTDRFLHSKQPTDLEDVIKYENHAITLTPDGHRDLAQWHCNQAETFILRYRQAGPRDNSSVTKSLLVRALASFKNASRSATAAPRDKFQFALRWVERASQVPNDALSSIEAYQTAITLLPEFAWLGATTNQRYEDLSSAENLGANGAHAAIRRNDYGLALEFLENARCVAWNQLRMLRSPLDELQKYHPDQAHRLRTAARQLHDNISDHPESQLLPSDSVDEEKAARVRRDLAKQYSDLLTKARKLQGFSDLLRPMKSSSLMGAARNGPVVVITCRENGSDALIVLPRGSSVKHLDLRGFTEAQAQRARIELAGRLRRPARARRNPNARRERRPMDAWDMDTDDTNSVRNMLRDLWTSVVQPVLQFLELKPVATGGKLPHITWCPAGAMSFLPLHAAGDYHVSPSRPGSRVFEYAVSSYTPTLSALLAPPPKPLGRGDRVLAIGQSDTPGHNPLPGTVQELVSLKAHTQKIAKYTELTGAHATKASVLGELEKHHWVHFACHAHQDSSDPLGSGFFLHQDELSLASINRRSFGYKGLAFLAACQTAMGDGGLPDESIHLASGMLVAGYSSVIATMWSIVDEDAPIVTDKVYATLMKDGKIGNGEAARALHGAVAELRSKVKEEEFLRWVPYIHMGQ